MTKDITTEVITGPISIDSYADNLQAKLQVANILLKSGMAPNFKTPEAVLGAVLYGKELGFSPIRALNMINVINGRPTLSAQGLKAKAIENGGRFKTIEWTNTVCTLEVSRGEWIETFTYTMQDATLAQLAGKDNWRKMPKAMLYARCISVAVNNMWADVLGGLYSTEEMIDSTPSRAAKVEVAEVVEVVDESTGEILVESPPTLTPEQIAGLKAIEDADFQTIGDHRITIKGKKGNRLISVRDAIFSERDWVMKNLHKFDDFDKQFLAAYLEYSHEGPIEAPKQVNSQGEELF